MILTRASVSDDGNQITQFIDSAICLVDSDFPPLNDIYVCRCSSGNIMYSDSINEIACVRVIKCT